MLNSRAFSLIELSIVLIIIGLLVAGITGGASLIASARNRAFVNEVLSWKQAVFAFKAAKGRYPGDIRNIGKFGSGSGYGYAPYTYAKSDFAPPFDTGSFTPSQISAPFVELYTEKISDFKPTTSDESCTGSPCSKAYPKIYLPYFYNTVTSGDTLYYMYNFRTNINTLYVRYTGENQINPKVVRALDEKIDDGIYNSGNLRFSCYKKVGGVDTNSGTTSYDDSINTKSYCSNGFYDLRLE